MASNSELFELIKSLDSKEKRYLKLLMKALSGPKQKKYQKHFDAIVSMKKYDELLWKRKMGIDSTTKKLKETNNYLYDFVLKGLLMYSNPKDKSKNRVLVDAQKINMLTRKGLYKTAAKRIDELIEVSEEQQFFDLSLHLINEKRSINFGTGKLTRDRDFAHGIYTHFEANLEICKNINDYLRLLEKTKLVFDKWTTVRSKEIETAYEDLLNHPLFEHHEKALSLRSKNLYFVLKLVLLLNLYREQACFEEIEASLVYFDADNLGLDNHLYLGFMLNKKMEICYFFNKYDDLRTTLQVFDSKVSQLKTYAEKKYWFAYSIRHHLRLFYVSKDIDGFIKYISGIDSEKYATIATDYYGVYAEIEFEMAKLYHLAGDLKSSN